MAKHFSNRNLMTGTYGVVIEDEGVQIFVEIVQGSLGDSIFDLNTALDILLVTELYLVIHLGCLIPLVDGLALDDTLLIVLHFVKLGIFGLALLHRNLFVERQRLVVLAPHVELSVRTLHQAIVFATLAMALAVHHGHGISDFISLRFII